MGHRATFAARLTTAANLTVARLRAGDAWVGSGQVVDTVAVTAPNTSSPDWHVTRSVLDLLDQVTETWDARGLSGATWQFAYDRRGQRTKVANTTGVGSRYALADAAGNFPYRDYDDAASLREKAVRGVANLDTPEARERLEGLAASCQPATAGAARAWIRRRSEASGPRSGGS